MTNPTADDVKGWSLVDFAGLGFDDPRLGVLVTRAIEYVEDVTGRDLDATSFPSTLVSTAQEAVQKRVEQLAFQAQQDHAETAADELIGSFSAGSYSETKRNPKEVREARLVNPWPALHDLLWRLMTEAKRDEWLGWFGGEDIPAFEVTEVDWSTMGYPGPYDGYHWGA